MDDDNKKLKLEVEVAYDSSGEKLAVEGIKNVDKAVQDLGKSSDDASKKLAQVITSNMDPVTKKQVEGVLASMNKLDATMKKVNQDIEQMLNVPAGTTSGELSGLEGDAKKVTKNVKEATQETEKLASANKRAADQGERLANVQNKKAKKPAEKAATPDIDKTLNTAAVDKMVEKSAKATKNIEDMSAAASAVATVTNTLVDAADKLAAGLNAEIAALENVGSNASLTARELAILNSVHESFAQTASANAKAFAEEQAKINAGVSALSTAAIPAVEGLEDASSKLTDTFNKEAEALERVSTYADLSQKDIRALENIEKSFGRTASASVKEVVAEQEKHNKELEEAIRLATIQKNKQDLLARSQQITTGIATGGPLNIPDFEYIQRIKNVNVSPEEYAANLEKIKRNFDALTQEIEQYMTLQNTTLESAQADLVKAQATEDSKERLEALNSVLARHNRMALENSVALKQANLLSRDFVVGIIERTNATEADGDAEEDLKQEVVDAANAYLRMLDAIEATNNQAKLRKADIKDEIKGTKDLVTALNKLEAAQRKAVLAAQRDVDKVSDHFVSIANTINQITKRFGQSLTRYITVPLAGIAIKAAKFTAEMEANLKSIQILLYNNAQEAEALYDQVVAYSAATPYELPDLTEATKQLLSYGTASQNVMGELKMLGDLAQNDAKKLDSLTQAFGKSQARGAIHMRELNRFILSGIPIMQALADVTDKSMGDVVESVRKGEISFRTVRAAMVSLTSEGGRFHNMSAELAYTLKGRWATMSDEINLALKSFINDYMPVIMDAVNKVINLAQALRDMTKVQKDVILGHIKTAMVIGPVLLGISALSASFSAITKVVKGFIAVVKGINVALTATGIIAAGTTATLASVIAPIMAIAAGIGAVTFAVSKYKKGIAEINALAAGAEQRNERIEGLDPSIRNLYSQREKGLPFSDVDLRIVQAEFTHLSEDTITSILTSMNMDLVLNKLKNEDVAQASREAVMQSLWGPIESILTSNSGGVLAATKEERRLEQLKLRKDQARLDLINQLGGVTSEEITDRDIMEQMVKSYTQYSYVPSSGRRAGYLEQYEGPNQEAGWPGLFGNIPELSKLWAVFTKQEDEYAKAIDKIGRAKGIGEMLQQAFIGAIFSVSEEDAGSGESAAELFISNIQETSDDAFDRIRRYQYAMTQDDLNFRDVFYGGLTKGLVGEKNIEEYLLSQGIKPGDAISGVLQFLFAIPESETEAAMAEVDKYFDIIGDEFAKLPGAIKEDKNLQYAKDNFILDLFPNEQKTLEAKQAMYDFQVDMLSSMVQAHLTGYTEAGIPFKTAIERLKEEHGDLVTELETAMNLSKSEKAFKQITEEVNNTTSALLELTLSETPIDTFKRKLMTLLDGLNLDQASAEYTAFFNAIVQGAQNMAEAAYLTEKSNLQDVIDQLVMSEEEYFKHALAKKGISSDKLDELWNLKTLGDTNTKAKEAEDAYKDLSNSIMEAVLSGEAYQRFVYSDVNKYAANDVDKLVAAYKRLTAAQKVTTLSEEMEGTKTDYEDRLFKLNFPNAKNQALALMYRDYDAAVKEYANMQKSGASTEELDAVSRKIDKMMDGINYVRKNFSAIVFGEREQELQQQLDAAKAVTDEEKIRLLAVEGVTLEQARTLFYLNKQVEAYEKLQESAKALKDFAKTNLDTPKYVKSELTKKGGILEDIFKARGVEYTGNIDLYDRLISSDDKTGEKYSLKSITVQDDDGQWVNIPTVFGRNVLGESAAFERYRKSGQHLGKYDTSWEAERRAMDVSDVMGDILQFTEVPHDINYAIKPTTKGPRGVARIEERNALLTTLRDDTLQSKLDAVETFKTGGMTLDQLTKKLGELDDDAMDSFKLIDELFPVTNAMLFDDALKDIGDSLISLGLTGVVGMFEDFGKALASGSVGADSFMTSLDNMLSSLVDALPQLFLNAGLSLISVGKWKVGLALVGMSAIASLFKGLKDGEDTQVIGTATGIKLTKSAKGNLFNRGELLNSPTLFKTPSGFNLGGEQGTEAIMPLGRTTEGKLGIYAMGGGGDNQANVVVNVINQSDNSESEVVERTDASGTKTIDVIIKNVVNKQISEGGYDRSLGARYGVRNRGIA